MNTSIRALGQRGTTLIELMIALVLTSIVTLAIMKTYVTQHENYLVQDDVAVMQQRSRASLDEMTRNIRMAGHHLPLGLPSIVASNTNPDTITINYHGNNCETYLVDKMPNTAAELKCNEVSCFEEEQWVYVYDPDSAVGEWFQISEVQASNHLQHRFKPKNLSRQYDADAIVLALNQIKFFVDDQTDPDNPCLMVQMWQNDPEIYSDHIVDLQFQYRLANGTIVDEPILISDVREVLINVTAQSTLEGSSATIGLGQTDQDGGRTYKTRTYASSVSLRNM
jgi:Tfp pilus assembly protein PilV